jgi:hypothetical protein
MSNVPAKLKGVEFEDLLMQAANREEKNGALTMSRYGVTLSYQNGQTLGVPSKPDFEGVLATGRQFIIEAKVCGDPAFPMVAKQIKPKQVQHMLDRSRFNVPCFLVIHFTARVMKTFTDPAITIAIPVSDADPRWQRFVDAHAEAKRQSKAQGKPVAPAPQGGISRDDAHRVGILIPWVTPKGCRKALPDLIAFLWPEARRLELPTLFPDNATPHPPSSL